MMALAREKVTLSTDYLLFPETAIPEPHWEHEVEYLYATEQIRLLIDSFPNLKTVIGSLSSRLFLPGEELTSAAKPFKDGNGFYENYNDAIFIDSSENTEMHIKSKLVLGVEKVPFISSIPFLKKLSINLGGTSGGYGTTDSPTLFYSKTGSSVLAPIICYESIYGEYVTEYSRKGANIFAIITNDGWWDDSPGYHQHLAYARLRAIENRRAIVRSANTGISAVIDQKGEILDQTEWWVPAVISAKVSLSDQQTFYVQYGDFIGRVMSFVAPLMILLTLVKSLNKTGQRLSTK
ncbi:MAG: apolipoprotein N-acyltransferase [Flavobacteriales bacterium]|nr:apolipoprotein N-acyltransferase [Flavobacteriales bacterium]